MRAAKNVTPAPLFVVAALLAAPASCFSSGNSGGDAGVIFVTGDAGATAEGGADASAGPDAPALSCPAPAAGPTTHSSKIAADETWTAASSPHLITTGFSVTAKLTLEPCAQLQIAAGVTVTVGVGGSIVGAGTAAQPISIGAADPSKPWGSFEVVGGAIRLAYTTVSDGGLPAANARPFTVGTFMSQQGSNPLAPLAALSLDHVTIRGSLGDGIQMSGTQFDPVSTALVITGSAQYPVRMTASALGTLPDGTYTGNAFDEILVAGGTNIASDATIHARGVPYHVGDAISSAQMVVGSTTGGLATLTIEPGVTMRFEKTGIMRIDPATGTQPATGALVAPGSAAAPIVFTSAAPAPAAGDWVGLVFGETPAPADSLAFVTIEYAGATTGTIGASCPRNSAAAAALQIVGGQPASGFLSSSTIRASAQDGVYRGWQGNEVDFMSGNTFDAVPGCKQTFPVPTSGQCPSPPPCP